MYRDIILIDQGILLWIQDTVRNDILTTIFTFLSKLGNYGVLWTIISIGLLIPVKTRKIGIMALCSLTIAYMIDNVILKNMVNRVRPYEVVSGLECLIGKLGNSSFPSDQAGNSFAVAIVLLRCLPRKFGMLALFLAILIGCSGLYVGVHYPTDVLCGVMIGTMVAILVSSIGKLIIETYLYREKVQ